MAIVNMQKLSICANQKHRREIVAVLQNMGIIELNMSELEEDPDLQTEDTNSSRTKYEKRAQSFEQALAQLKAYAPQDGDKPGLFFEKKDIPRSRLDEAVRNRHKYNVAAADILQAEKKISECTGIIQKDENQKLALTPWMNLDIPMDFSGTRSTSVLIGTLPGTLTEADVYAAAARNMPEPAAVDAHVVSSENSLTNIVVVCLSREAAQVEENLRASGFSRPSQTEDGTPKQICEKYDAEIEAQKKEIEEQKARIVSYKDWRSDFRLMSDYYTTRADRYRMLGQIPQTKNVFFLEGWLPADKAADVSALLTDRFGAYVETEQKREDELEPTLLHNNPFSRNAEGVLESYGLPQHGRVDPTFVMSIFYVIFFGMMLSDAGYGIVMTIACLVILLKKKKLEEGLAKMLKLFFWCGLSTTFWGFMYGGFFGDAIDVAAKTFFGYTGDTILKPLWFAPLEDPMKLLVYCLLFGLIHLFFGLGMKGYEDLKAKDITGFISDVLSWYLFILGLVLMLVPSSLFASMAGVQITFPAWLNMLARIMAIAGAVIILIMSGRDRGNHWAIRIALGAYDLYGVTSWLSDLLSYSRLLALGMATGVIASVVNMMGSMFGSGPVGVIVFIVVFLLGHTLNIGINALGAYVHTNRLQYVEFFNKFYDAGGRKFNPFRTSSKYFNIKEEKLQ